MPVQAKNGRPATADPGWAWAPYAPEAQRPWNLALAAHLYRRATFGAGWGELQQALSDGPQRTVDKLLRPPADVEAFNRRYDESENAAAGSVDGLRAWWLRRMMETPHPLLEKMTLFWHSYFAVNAGPVNNPGLMRDYVRLLRSHALGSFDSLLQDTRIRAENVVADQFDARTESRGQILPPIPVVLAHAVLD